MDRERLAANVLRWLPKSSYGRLVGFWARRPVPRALRARIYGRFARLYGIDLGALADPLDSYPNFDAFFTRRLRPETRPVDPDPRTAVSPVDGVVVEAGLAAGGRLIQAKGIDYTLRGLLIDPDAAQAFSGGAYLTLYLAPGDYHRIHAPVDGRVTGYRHIPGAFFPVNRAAVRHVAGLFARNERLVTHLVTPLGKVAVVKVAATGVGNVSVRYDPAARTRAGRRGRRVDYDDPRPIAKGEELGTFHLGSTVIVLFEPGRVVLEPLAAGQRLLIGQRVACRAASAAGDVAA